MLQVRVVCCQNMMPAVFTENELFHGINIKLIQNVKHPFQIGLELVDFNKLHKIGITSKHLLKLFSYVAIKRFHFVVILKMVFNE